MTTDIKPTVRQTRIETGEDYIESLRNRSLCVYLMGERVEEPVDHPIIRPSINAVAETTLLITLEIVSRRLLIKEKNLRYLSRRPQPSPFSLLPIHCVSARTSRCPATLR